MIENNFFKWQTRNEHVLGKGGIVGQGSSRQLCNVLNPTYQTALVNTHTHTHTHTHTRERDLQRLMFHSQCIKDPKSHSDAQGLFSFTSPFWGKEPPMKD